LGLTAIQGEIIDNRRGAANIPGIVILGRVRVSRDWEVVPWGTKAMSIGLSMCRFGFAPCVVALLLSPVTVLAADWYWVNDFGGTWDEEIGGLTSWRDPSDNPGMPAAGDDALLVLPYRDSFCDPGGGCFTQPVVVLYRSDTDPTLSELIIESQNMLVQEEGTGATPDQLNLTSDVEIVGGSDRTFSPPPSFPLPDPPGIWGGAELPDTPDA
jgi:hypothetical protein